ncbi:Hypothetical predicted protein, partial [Paramuricea clavata]
NKSNDVIKNSKIKDVISRTPRYYLPSTGSNEAPSATNGSTNSLPVNNHQVCVPKEGSSETVFCSPSLTYQPAVVCDMDNNLKRKPSAAKECTPSKVNGNIEPSIDPEGIRRNFGGIP